MASQKDDTYIIYSNSLMFVSEASIIMFEVQRLTQCCKNLVQRSNQGLVTADIKAVLKTITTYNLFVFNYDRKYNKNNKFNGLR